MESIGAFLNEDWDSFSRMFSIEDIFHEGLNFRAPSIFWPKDEEANTNASGFVDETLFYSSDPLNIYHFPYFSQETSSNSSGSNSVSLPTSSPPENRHFCDSNPIPVTDNVSESMYFCTMDDKINNSLARVLPDHEVTVDNICEKEEICNGKLLEIDDADSQPVIRGEPGMEVKLKRKFELREEERGEDQICTQSSENLKKKYSRVSKDAQKNKRKVPSKKNQNQNQNQNPSGNKVEESDGGPNGQSSSCYSSEDDSNASQVLNGDSKGSALNLNGKTRASRGAATDPQSLYARKRRERINERLRTLQNLVPNGTKVDISTMLEEALHYVKFLQLQIKLLSSDDLWMYAPIAYNGMDMGLYQNISPTL